MENERKSKSKSKRKADRKTVKSRIKTPLDRKNRQRTKGRNVEKRIDKIQDKIEKHIKKSQAPEPIHQEIHIRSEANNAWNRCSLLCGRISTKLCSSSNVDKNDANAWKNKVAWAYRHPVVRIFTVCCLILMDIISYPEDPIYYSQTKVSIPVAGLATNVAFLFYVNPVRFPRYFVYQLFGQLLFVAIFVVLGEYLIRRCVLQRLFNLRGFKESKGTLALGAIWVVLALWAFGNVTNYLVEQDHAHSWEGFLDYVLERDTNDTSSGGGNSNANQKTPDSAFKFLKWAGVIDYGTNFNETDQKVRYVTPLLITNDLPLTNETFCRISRLFVSFGDLFTFFSILDMIMQDKKRYAGCCHKAKTTGCWNRHRVKIFWVYVTIVLIGVSVSARVSVGWKSLKWADSNDWKGKVGERINLDLQSNSTNRNFALKSKNSVLLALDNEGQLAGDRYTLYDSSIWSSVDEDANHSVYPTNQSNSNRYVRDEVVFFADHVIGVNDRGKEDSLYLWLSNDNLNEQRVMGTMTKTLVGRYQNGSLKDLGSPKSPLTSNPSETTLVGSLKPTSELDKFPPLRGESEAWQKTRGYFATTELERIVIKLLVLLLDALVLHQDPQFPRFEDEKKEKRKAKEEGKEEEEEEEERGDNVIKLVGLEGNKLNLRTLVDTLYSCFSYKSLYANRVGAVSFEGSDSEGYEDRDYDVDYFDLSASEEEEHAWWWMSKGNHRNYGSRNFKLNAEEAWENFLPVVGLGPNRDEARSPHLEHFGGEADRYRFNRNCCARIFCSPCNKKKNLTEEMNDVRASNLCKQSCRNWMCCAPNVNKRRRQVSADGAETTKRESVPEFRLRRSDDKTFVTARWLTYSVFVIVLLVNSADLLQQVNYDPANYGQVVDDEHRIHTVYPRGGFLSNGEEFGERDVIFSALHIMSPWEVSLTVESPSKEYWPTLGDHLMTLWNYERRLTKKDSNATETPIAYPQQHSLIYGKEPYVKYKTRQVGWGVTLEEFYSAYGDVSVADGTIQPEPLGTDYALEILLDFVGSGRNREDEYNGTSTTDTESSDHLQDLRNSASKNVKWLYLYDTNSDVTMSPEDLVVSGLCPRSGDALSNDEDEITYKLYGVSCKCWKFVGFRVADVSESAVDGIYDLDQLKGKTPGGFYYLEPRWENTKVRTSENRISALRFQSIASDVGNDKDLGEIGQCYVSDLTNPSSDHPFLDLSKESYSSSYLSQGSAACSSLEIHTLVVKKSSLVKLFAKANGMIYSQYNRTCENKPFVDAKWLERCHTYQEGVDSRCGPCHQIETIDSVSTKDYLSELISYQRSSVRDDVDVDFDEDALYTTTKKKLAYLVDIWETGDGETKDKRRQDAPLPSFSEVIDLGFWFGHRSENLLLSEGYSPSSDKAYVNEELPVLLTQRFDPVLTLGPLNLRYLFVPLKTKRLLAVIPALLVFLILSKIFASFVYRSLKKWERKLSGVISRFVEVPMKIDREGEDHDVIFLDENSAPERDGLDRNDDKYKFYKCKLGILFCCRKLHGSKRKTLNPRTVYAYFAKELERETLWETCKRIFNRAKPNKNYSQHYETL